MLNKLQQSAANSIHNLTSSYEATDKSVFILKNSMDIPNSYIEL